MEATNLKLTHFNLAKERKVLEYFDKYVEKKERVKNRKKFICVKTFVHSSSSERRGQIHPFQLFNINQIRLGMNELGNFWAEKIKLCWKSFSTPHLTPLTGLN